MKVCEIEAITITMAYLNPPLFSMQLTLNRTCSKIIGSVNRTVVISLQSSAATFMPNKPFICPFSCDLCTSFSMENSTRRNWFYLIIWWSALILKRCWDGICIFTFRRASPSVSHRPWFRLRPLSCRALTTSPLYANTLVCWATQLMETLRRSTLKRVRSNGHSFRNGSMKLMLSWLLFTTICSSESNHIIFSNI